MYSYLRICDDAFAKTQWAIFFFWNFIFNESEFSKDFLQKIFWLDQLLLLFWSLEKWEWLHLPNFVFSIVLVYCIMAEWFSISSATPVKSLLFWKLIMYLRAFSTTGWRKKKESFIYLRWPLKSVITISLTSRGVFTNFIVDLSNTGSQTFFIRRSFPHLARFLHS